MIAAIRTRDLSKDYHVGFWRPRPYRALDRLSIEVAPGEVFGFLGPNGAGKTTTLKLLMQLVFPTSGEAEILGRPAGDVAISIAMQPSAYASVCQPTSCRLCHCSGDM